MYATERSILVNDVMSYPVVTCKKNSSIKEIAQKMQRHNIDSVVVTNELNQPIGIVTEKDIVRRLLTKRRGLLFANAKKVMSTPVVTITKEMKLEDAAKLMVEKKIKKLCVVDEGKKVIGIVTEGDIVKNASYLIDVLKDIIESGYIKE